MNNPLLFILLAACIGCNNKPEPETAPIDTSIWKAGDTVEIFRDSTGHYQYKKYK